MPRKHRVWFPGATYHITARGNRKDTIFHEKKDYEYYMQLLKESQQNFPFDLHAYCLMPNHIHLLLETNFIPPGKIMKYIHMHYAIRFNKKYNYTGHLFQGRYNAKIVLDDEYFLQVSKYIHQNPTEADIVKKPEHYTWSSYPIYAKGKENPLITKGKTLQHFPTKEDYIAFVLKKNEEPSSLHNEGLSPL